MSAYGPVADNPWGLALHPAGSRLYVSSAGAASGLVVIDAATHATVADVSASTRAEPAVHPDGSRVYVGGANEVLVVSTASDTVVATVPLPGVAKPYGIAVHPDGSRVYVSDSFFRIFTIETAGNTIIDVASIGLGPYGVAVHPDETRV